VRPNREHSLPVVLSVDEVQRILGCLRLPRYRVCLSTIYTCGLRLQEWLAALGRALPAGRQWPQRPKYLAPYIFRVAISNRRILKVEDGRVPIRVQRRLTRHRLSHHRSPSSAARPVARPCARARSLILKEVNRREQRRCTQTSSPPRGRGRRFPAPVLARAWLPKSGLRQTVTPAAEPPGLACDPPQSRSPRAGWRFTCADGLPLAHPAARFPKRCFALVPKWEYNLAADQHDRLSSTRIMRRLRAA